jgi:hypothetical protein
VGRVELLLLHGGQLLWLFDCLFELVGAGAADREVDGRDLVGDGVHPLHVVLYGLLQVEDRFLDGGLHLRRVFGSYLAESSSLLALAIPLLGISPIVDLFLLPLWSLRLLYLPCYNLHLFFGLLLHSLLRRLLLRRSWFFVLLFLDLVDDLLFLFFLFLLLELHFVHVVLFLYFELLLLLFGRRGRPLLGDGLLAGLGGDAGSALAAGSVGPLCVFLPLAYLRPQLLLLLLCLFAHLLQLVLQLLPDPLLLLPFLLGAEIRLGLLLRLLPLFREVDAQLFGLVEDALDEYLVSLLFEELVVGLFQVGGGSALDEGGLKELQNGRPFLFLLLEHLVDEFPQLPTVVL